MAELTLTDSTFETEVLNATVPVLVDFWAAWCGPCQVQDPIVEEVAKAVEGKATVGKINVDDNPVMAQKYGIMSIPTLLVFDKGAVVRQFVGVQSKETLVEELTKLTH